MIRNFGVGHPFPILMKTRVPGFGPWPYGLWPIDPKELLGFLYYGNEAMALVGSPMAMVGVTFCNGFSRGAHAAAIPVPKVVPHA